MKHELFNLETLVRKIPNARLHTSFHNITRSKTSGPKQQRWLFNDGTRTLYTHRRHPFSTFRGTGTHHRLRCFADNITLLHKTLLPYKRCADTAIPLRRFYPKTWHMTVGHLPYLSLLYSKKPSHRSSLVRFQHMEG